VFQKLPLRTSEHPCYGFRLKPCSVASAGEPSLRDLNQEAIFVRNIFRRKCHELCWGLGALIALSLLASPVLFAQQPPPLPSSVAPPPPSEIPNAANPDQRLKLQRPGAPGPNEYTLDSDTQESEGDLRHLRGHVHLEMIDKKLDADEVDYNDDTGDVEARGNVRYENFLDGTKLNCDHAKYNVTTETGIFYEVRGTSETKIIARPGLLTTNNPFYFEGQWGERVDGKYIINE